MKKIVLIGLLFCAALLCPGLAAAATQEAPSYQPERELKRYFPGDYVHILVNAPLDTAKITGVMPNGDTIELIHDRRAKIWTGLWQVPIGFKSGSYSAELQASDIEGNKYAGLTSPFIVGELTMITMIQKPTSPEAETQVQQGQRMSRETALLAAKAVTPIPHPIVPPAAKVTTTKTVVSPNIVAAPEISGPPETVALPKPVAPPKVVAAPPKPLPPLIVPPPAKKKIAVAAKKKTRVVKPKAAVNFVEAKEKGELNLTKAKLVTSARYYMERMDFDQVQAQLRTLVKIDPRNQQYKKMLQRVDTVIKTEKEKK
jgi:hypothetical protein